MRRILATAVLLTALTTAACASSKPASTPAPSAIPATQALGRADDPSGLAACAMVAKAAAADDGTAMTTPGIVLPIIQAAAKSTTPEVVQAGEELGARYRSAILAKGTDDELSTKIDAVTAGTELRTACIKAGLDD